MSFELISVSTSESARSQRSLSRAIIVIKFRSRITTFLAHFRASFASIDRCNSTFVTKSFPPRSLLSSLRGSSPHEPLDSKEGKALFCSPGKNLIPFLPPSSFVEYYPCFPRDSSRVPFPSSFPLFLFSLID